MAHLAPLSVADAAAPLSGLPPLQPPPAVARPVGANLPTYRSADLFGPGAEVLIEHQAQVYRLRRTALGKLILTK